MRAATATVSRTRQVPLSADMTTIHSRRVLVRSPSPTVSTPGRRSADDVARGGEKSVSLSKAHRCRPSTRSTTVHTLTNTTQYSDTLELTTQYVNHHSTPPALRQRSACAEPVYVRTHVSGIIRSNFTKFSLHIAFGHRSVLLRRCNALCTSGFVDGFFCL